MPSGNFNHTVNANTTSMYKKFGELIDAFMMNPKLIPPQRSQLTSMGKILRSVQKLTVKTDSIDSKSYLLLDY